MKRIGVVLGNRTEMAIRDVVVLQADIEIVGEALEKFELLMMVKETRADAVILSAGESDIPGLCSHLLGEYPNLTIVVLGADGKHTVEQLCLCRWGLTDPSIESVLGALRTAIRRPCDWTKGQGRFPGPGARDGMQ